MTESIHAKLDALAATQQEHAKAAITKSLQVAKQDWTWRARHILPVDMLTLQ